MGRGTVEMASPARGGSLLGAGVEEVTRRVNSLVGCLVLGAWNDV